MKKLEFKQRLIKYMNIEAMSRYEQPVARELKANISSKYNVSYDKFGSIIFHKPSKNENALKIMIAAHMDEVGYLVKNITQKGQILLSPVGGIWASTVIGTKAKLITTQNKEFLGVFGHTSIHIMERDKITKAISNDELYADFGFMSQEEAIQKGVEIGDRVQISGETVFFENEDLIGGKSMDNRAGVSVLEYIANNLANFDLDVDLYLVGTVQEEVGTRGARTSVSLIRPDIAIALDTTSSHDTYGTIPGTTELFKGAAIRIKDNGTLMDPKLVSLMMKTAKNHKIKAYKFIAAGGGTDAAELQFSPNGGASVLTISLPQRYLHSPIGVCAISDLLAAGDLLTSFIKDFDSRKWNN